jgi:hypothetical protein
MLKFFKKHFMRILLGVVAIAIIWLFLDSPTGSVHLIQGVITQAVYVPGKASGGYTRILVHAGESGSFVFTLDGWACQ